VVVSTNPFNSLLGSRPRKVGLLAAVLVIVLVVSSYAYMASLQPQEGPLVSVISPPLEFSMQLNKTEFLLGEDVMVRLSLKNIGNETIGLSWADFRGYEDVLMYFDFIVTDSNNTVVFQYSKVYGALFLVLDRTLNPGEQLVSAVPWIQITVHPQEVPSHQQVPAGTYNVRGLSRKMGLTVGNQTTIITLETPTITFTIT
jgi:hypothetical protein